MSKAFSSMVFMIREIQSFTLHMREVLFYEDLRGILLRVREEMHASFLWLFQQVFSATPTLMVYVMILLANFTVYSIGGSSNSALASASAAPPPMTTVTELTTEANEKLDSSMVKTFFVSSPTNGNTTSVGGNNNGGGGNIRPVLNGADGDDGSEQFKTIIPEGVSSTLGSTTAESEKTSVSGQDELRLWNSIVEEAEQMRYSKIDHETRKRFVSPLDARVEEADEEIDYFRTELLYQTGLSQEPSNPLLLANYAQFLYIVSNDYDRAEEYFKRAVGVEPKDAEALSKYATFLWRARDDLWAAEETFLEAIDADPTNSFYAANYANFLWNTGGDETCFPLDESQEDTI
ncbi:Tetratricopeptide repeat (TPR)-like superfamily protein [Raphanus sativus]|nr:Tetratricopeptide repeat (TPR)-like superfamily protein [Raphanus sativus]